MKDDSGYTIIPDFQNNPLVEAIKNGDLNSVQEAIKKGQNVNIASYSDPENPKLKSSALTTILDYAIEQVHDKYDSMIKPISEQLEPIVSNVNRASGYVAHSIMQSIALTGKNDELSIKQIIQNEMTKRNYQVSGIQIEQLCKTIEEALNFKANNGMNNSIKIVEELLKAQAIVTESDIKDVCHWPGLEGIELLLNHGVDATKVLQHYLDSIRNEEYRVEVITKLVERGANLENPELVNKIIQKTQTKENTKFWLDCGINANTLFLGILNCKKLYLPSRPELPIMEWMDFFNEQNINFKQTYSQNMTALHYMAKKELSSEELYQVTDFLLKKGVDINAQDSDGNTALHIAAKHLSYSVDMIYRLIERGADLNIQNSQGKTARDLLVEANQEVLGAHGIIVTSNRYKTPSNYSSLSFFGKMISGIRLLIDALIYGKKEIIQISLGDNKYISSQPISSSFKERESDISRQEIPASPGISGNRKSEGQSQTP